MSLEVNIESYYWNKESINLFDYDSSDCLVNKHISSTNTTILSKENEIIYISPSSKYLFPIKVWLELIQIKFEKEICSIIPSITSSTSQNDKSYFSIKHTFKSDNILVNGYHIKEGDILKLGKLNLEVKEIRIIDPYTKEVINLSKAKEKTLSDNEENEVNDNELAGNSRNVNHGHNHQQETYFPTNQNIQDKLILSQNQKSYNHSKKQINKVKKHKKIHFCRFCLCEDNEFSNPLINPCKCSGTMKYIHLDCLKNWLKNKIVSKISPFLNTYSMRHLQCELCKSPVPIKFKVKSEVFSLIDFETPDTSYVILEQIVGDDQEKSIYLIIFRQKTGLTLGRSNDSDVKISDISVSRHHCNIYLRKNSIFIQDNNSKFGTLLMYDSPINLILNKQIGMQIGKYFLNIKLQKTFCSMLSCKKVNVLYSNYNEYLLNQPKKKKVLNKNDFYMTEQIETSSESESVSIEVVKQILAEKVDKGDEECFEKNNNQTSQTQLNFEKEILNKEISNDQSAEFEVIHEEDSINQPHEQKVDEKQKIQVDNPEYNGIERRDVEKKNYLKVKKKSSALCIPFSPVLIRKKFEKMNENSEVDDKKEKKNVEVESQRVLIRGD